MKKLGKATQMNYYFFRNANHPLNLINNTSCGARFTFRGFLVLPIFFFFHKSYKLKLAEAVGNLFLCSVSFTFSRCQLKLIFFVTLLLLKKHAAHSLFCNGLNHICTLSSFEYLNRS